MAYRTLELTLIAAHDLKSVNLLTPLQVYATVSLTGDPRNSQRTPPDRHGGRNPSWNSVLRLNVPVSGDLSRHALHILLRTERALGDRDVGEVFVPIADLLGGFNGLQFRSYQIRKLNSGKPKGVIDFSFKLSEPIGAIGPAHTPDVNLAAYALPQQGKPSNSGKNDVPVLAYPAAVAPAGYSKVDNKPSNSGKNDEPVLAYPAAAPVGYPQQAPTYAQAPAYSYAPAPAYSYAPGPQYGYQYQQPQVVQPQVVRPQRKKNNFGLGLLGGALGGLLIGDMISDAAAYDAGYDDGFDAGGFDGGFDF